MIITGGGRCNVMHNPMKGPVEISKVSIIVPVIFKLEYFKDVIRVFDRDQKNC